MHRMTRAWRRLRALAAASLIGLMPGVRAVQAQDADEAAWIIARSSGTIDAFQSYLDAYPFGRHADAAFACIIAGSRGAAADFCRIEPAAGPEPTETTTTTGTRVQRTNAPRDAALAGNVAASLY